MKVPIKRYFDKEVIPMKKWIIFALALMLVLAFTGCDKHTSDAPMQIGKDNLLHAWTGEFSEAKLTEAINEYQKNYCNFVVDADNVKKGVFFTVDFEDHLCSVTRLSRTDGKDINVELGGYIDLYIPIDCDGNKITIPTDWWSRNNYGPNESVWSYLVRVEDKEGLEHYYYFRVDYSALVKVQSPSVPTTPTNPAPSATATPTNPTGNGNEQPKLRSFRVEGIKEDGMILYMGANTYLYVKSNMKVYMFATVYMTYLDSDIKQQSGKFTDHSGKELEYTYVLENVLSIRFPVSGETTYG